MDNQNNPAAAPPDELVSLRQGVAELEAVDAGRRQMQEALRANEERYSVSLLRATLESTADGILVVDSEGQIVDFNERFVQMWRFPAGFFPEVRNHHHRDPGSDRRAIDFVLAQLKDPEGFLAKVQQLYAEPLAASLDLLEFKDGRTFERYSLPQRIDGLPVGRVWSFRDVTGRRRAEELWRTSEEHFRRIFDLSPVGAVLVAPDFRFLRCNEAFCRFVGYAESELQQKTFVDVTHPDDRQIGIAEARAILAGQLEMARLQKRYQHRSGRSVWGELTMRMVRDPAGNPLHFLTVIQDISERRQTEERLRDSEAKFSRAFHDAPVSMTISDIESGRYLDINAKCLALTGYTREEVIGRTSDEVGWTTSEDRRQRRELLRRDGRVLDLEIQVRRKDGGLLHGLYSAHVITVEGRKWLLSNIQDITGRRQIEERIVQLCHLRQQLLGAGSLDGKFKLVTDGVVAILGGDFARLWMVDKADLCDQGCQHAAVSEGPDVCRNRTRCLHLMASSGRYTRIDGGHRRVPLGCYKIGRVATGEDAGFVTNDVFHDPRVHDRAWAESLGLVAFAGRRLVAGDGRPIGVLALFSKKPILPNDGNLLEDIAATASQVILAAQAEQQRLDLETQMQQAQRLESLGILAGGIAHDFNNLLTAILGHANLALIDLAPESPARDSLREIDKASGRAAELCRQMLAYAGKGRFVLEPVNLSRLIEEVVQLLHVSISKKVVLNCQLAEGLPEIEADPAQMRQVAMNLVINAAEAIGDTDGVIAISTGVMQCDEDILRGSRLIEPPAPGRYIYLEVTDTGCGMDTETRARIFDPFFTTKFAGRGLGLAAVLGIVRSHRGALRVESERGRGTTFRVMFPAGAKAAAPAESGGGTASWRGTGTVLLVDDEEPVRNVAGRMLKHFGFAVLGAGDGREAVELYRAHAAEIVCVLLDLAMPRMDGEETFRELRRIRPDVRVVLASGYSDQEILGRFRTAGLAGFIEKPFQLETLGTKLHEVLAPRGTGVSPVE